MIERIVGDLPEWARHTNPLLRYEINRHQPTHTPGARLIRIVGWVSVLVLAILGGYLYATNLAQVPSGINPTESLWRVLFIPTLILQVVLGVAGISLGVNAVSEARTHQTWDHVRVTLNGTRLALLTRVVSILLFRLRGLLVMIMVVRVVLFGALLVELVSWKGRYLAFLMWAGSPQLPLFVGVMILSALVVSSFILPLTTTAVDISLGLLLSVMVRNRAIAGVIQVLMIVARIALVVGLYLAVRQWILLPDTIEMSDAAAWGLLSVYSALGDWGLVFMQLSNAADIWMQVPYSMFIGIGLLLVALGQVVLVKGILAAAVSMADHQRV